MNSGSRKLPRFFIINPIKDRRIETRFETSEKVEFLNEDTGQVESATAYNIGRSGLRLDASTLIPVGEKLQIAFNNSADNIRCFCRVMWSKKKEGSHRFECGLSVEAWHGIVQGAESWKKLKGIVPERDRRRKLR